MQEGDFISTFYILICIWADAASVESPQTNSDSAQYHILIFALLKQHTKETKSMQNSISNSWRLDSWERCEVSEQQGTCRQTALD